MENPDIEPDDDFSFVAPTEASTSSNSSRSKSSKNRRRNESESEEAVEARYNNLFEKLDSCKAANQPKDACDHFGQYVSATLKQLPRVNQLIAQRQITETLMNHLFEAENITVLSESANGANDAANDTEPFNDM